MILLWKVPVPLWIECILASNLYDYYHIVNVSDIVMGESVIGYYRVRAVDYWGRSGPYSPVVHYDT